MTGKADLHIHTNHSDGFYSPKEIILKAKEKSLDIISITDHDNLSGIKEAAEARKKRALRILNKLRLIGIPISSDEIMEKADTYAIGRPHIAHALLEKGFVSSYFEAFNKYIGNGCPAYEKKVHLSPQSAFKIISDAGGLSFIAHPGNMPDDIGRASCRERV